MSEVKKKVFVFGATGAIGRLVTKQCLNAGYIVTGLTRNIEKATQNFPEVQWIKGDALDSKTYETALAGHDVVFGCTGSDGIKQKTVIFSQGYLRIMEAMERCCIERLIVITSCHDHPNAGCCFRLFVAPCILNVIYEDIDVFESWLKTQYKGSVRYTVMRPFQFTKKGPHGKYMMAESYTAESAGWTYKTIEADLADAMVRVYQQDLFVNKFVDVGSKKN
jgi:hypothetical protein